MGHIVPTPAGGYRAGVTLPAGSGPRPSPPNGERLILVLAAFLLVPRRFAARSRRFPAFPSESLL
jgi:hypothetical protein